jgi:molecular chaperone HscB
VLPASIPDISTHYSIFPTTLPHGPPPGSSFDIPLANLRREFISLQSLLHPDKYPPGPDKQRAEALSARINEAYRTLSDPLARAQYLLAHQHGIDVTAEDGARAYPQDQETLMQVLEVQEAIEEAAGESTIADLKRDNEKRVEECVRALGEAVDRGDIEDARQESVRLRFWYSIREGLREWEPGNTSVRLVH